MKHRGLSKRNHALRGIAVISVVLIILTAGLMTLITSIYYSRFTGNSCIESAKRFRSAFSDFSKHLDIDTFSDTDGEDSTYEAIREYIRGMCKISGVKFVYMFRSAPANDDLVFVMSAGAEDADDKLIKAERGLGTKVNTGERKYINQAYQGELAGPEHTDNKFGNVLTFYFSVDVYEVPPAALIVNDGLHGSQDDTFDETSKPSLELPALSNNIASQLSLKVPAPSDEGSSKPSFGVPAPSDETSQPAANVPSPSDNSSSADPGRSAKDDPPKQNLSEKMIVGVDFDITTLREEARSSVIRIVLIVVSILTAVLALLLLVLRKKVFTPIKRISMEMNSFEPEEEHTRLDIHSYYEIEEINNSFCKLSDDISGYIKNLRAMTDERTKAAAELSIARKIQIGMVPQQLALSGDGFELCASAVPAKEVGGDFYECIKKDDKVFIVIGDVSGKGIAAALFMAMAKNQIKEKLRSGLSPADALNISNDELCAENPEGMFVTAFAAVFDTMTGELIYANAGHTRPLIIENEDKRFLTPDTGIALGLFEDAGIKNEYTLLKSGNSITVYTDGVTEAVSADKALFGEERLLSCSVPGNCEQTASSIKSAISAFSSGCEQSDDITIVTMRFTGNTDQISTEFEPDMSQVAEMRRILMKLAGNSAKKNRIILACEEILVNIIEYSGTEKIQLILTSRSDRLTVRFDDTGTAFDPFAEPPLEKEFEEYETGGMGIRMVTEIAESTSYHRISEHNITVITFKL